MGRRSRAWRATSDGVSSRRKTSRSTTYDTASPDAVPTASHARSFMENVVPRPKS